MEKHSKVKSQLSAKIYDVGLESLEKRDDKFNSDLYKVNIFGKNVVIAPGRPIIDTDIPGLVYFYVYVIKHEKVVAKLGVYEKMTKEVKEIYDLSDFPDGSLLMFDLYYNKPDIMDDFEDQELKEEEEELEELDESESKENELNESESKGEEVNINGKSPSKTIKKSDKMVTMYKYLTDHINDNAPTMTPKQQTEKVLAMYRLLDENKKIESEKQKTYKKLLTMLLGSKGEKYVFDTLFIDKLKEILTSYNSELNIMFLFYLLENLLLIKFNFVNDINVPLSNKEVTNLNLFVPVNTKEVDIKIMNNIPYFIEERSIESTKKQPTLGTSLNTKPVIKKPEVSSLSKVVNLNEEEESVLSENSNEGLSNKGVNLNEESNNTSSSSNNETSSNEESNNKNNTKLGGKLRMNNNLIKMKNNVK